MGPDRSCGGGGGGGGGGGVERTELLVLLARIDLFS